MAESALAVAHPSPLELTGSLNIPLYERRAYLGYSERHRVPASYGGLTAERLTGILMQLQRGEVDQWADLVRYALKDDLLAHLYTTRITRVAQADFQIVPNEFGDPQLAKLGAEFVNELIGRVENWDVFVRNALDAIALGYSANEIEWDRDGSSRITYARNLHYINANRFRYDDQWKLRLYDHGTRSVTAGSMYGEPLWPGNWVVHTHNEIAGDPCDAGLMRMSIWRWLFRRWADTFWIQNLEKYGNPFVLAEVTPNTPPATRQVIKEAIVDLGIDRAAVVEAGGKITITPPPMGTGQASQHELYMDFGTKSLTATWLGAADVTQPGENGSQAAVGGRISATTDPRMVTDGVNLCGTLHAQLFKWLIYHNLHKFERCPPIPKMQFKTASDEQTTDKQDLAEQTAADISAGNAAAAVGQAQARPYEVRGDEASPSLDGTLAQPAAPATSAPTLGDGQPDTAPVVEKKQDTALNGAQVSSLLEVIKSVVDGQLPRSSAVMIIQLAFNFDAAQANAVLGEVGAGFEPTPEPAASPPPFAAQPTETSIPKASSRPTQGRPTIPSTSRATKTSPTTSHSIGPLASVLQGMSADHRR